MKKIILELFYNKNITTMEINKAIVISSRYSIRELTLCTYCKNSIYNSARKHLSTTGSNSSAFYMIKCVGLNCTPLTYKCIYVAKRGGAFSTYYSYSALSQKR